MSHRSKQWCPGAIFCFSFSLLAHCHDLQAQQNRKEPYNLCFSCNVTWQLRTSHLWQLHPHFHHFFPSLSCILVPTTEDEMWETRFFLSLAILFTTNCISWQSASTALSCVWMNLDNFISKYEQVGFNSVNKLKGHLYLLAYEQNYISRRVPTFAKD